MTDTARKPATGDFAAEGELPHVAVPKVNCKLLCIGCCACLIVLFAIMIPVSIFVIVPKVAQHTLDTTAISLPNLTMAACATPYSYLWNHAKITVPSLPIKADSTLLAYNQSVYTTACMVKGSLAPGYCCGDKWSQPCLDNGMIPKNDATDEEMFVGWYQSPEMTVSAGENHMNFNVILSDNMTVVMSTLVIPLFLARVPAKMILKADVSVKVMGLTIKGRTMHNVMTCFAVADPSTAKTVDLPQEVCYPEDKSKGVYNTAAYQLACDSGNHIPTTTATTTTAPPQTPAPTLAPPTTPTPRPLAFVF